MQVEIVRDGIRTEFRKLYPSAKFAVCEPSADSDELVIEALVNGHIAGISFAGTRLMSEPSDFLIDLGVQRLKFHMEQQVV